MNKNLNYFYKKNLSAPGFKPDHNELKRRAFHRLQCRIYLSIKDLSNSWETDAKCIDISLGGIGIEIDGNEELQINIKDRLELWIHLQDSLDPVHRYGRLVWVRQISPLFYRGGIRFEARLKAHNY